MNFLKKEFEAVVQPERGQWVEVNSLVDGDFIDLNGYWYPVLTVCPYGAGAILVLDGKAVGTISGFKCNAEEKFYKRSQND
jgi:hypothetical protein